MAVFAYTASLVTRVPKKLLGFPGVGMVFGSITISNYNSTRVEIAEISKAFPSGLTVLTGGMSSNGYETVWDVASKSIKCFYANPQAAGTISVLLKGGAAGTAIGYTADANDFFITKAAATDRTSVNVATFTGSAAAAATEVANDVNIGTVTVVAFGIVKF